MGDSEDQKPVESVEKPADATELPPQESPTDTSSWDDRPFVAPDGKVHIENLNPRPRVRSKPVLKSPNRLNQNTVEPIHRHLIVPRGKKNNKS